MKKIGLFVLAATILMGSTNIAHANELELQSNMESNEYEIYENYQDYSVDELVDLGLTRSDAIKIKNTSFEDIVMERASLPESTLRNMGYSAGDIEVLKSYNGEKLTADSEVVKRASATCTGSIRKVQSTGTGTNQKIKFRYSWVWSKSPLVTSADSAAVTWFAYDEYGNLKKSTVASKTGSITYVDYASGAETERSISTYTKVADEAAKVLVGMDYPVRIDHNSTGGKWAKRGEIEVQVSTGGRIYVLDSIDAGGKVGHATLSMSSITATITLASTLLDILAFSPSETVDEVALASKEILF